VSDVSVPSRAAATCLHLRHVTSLCEAMVRREASPADHVMMLDIIGAILLTCISAIAVALPALWYTRAPGGWALLAAHILWFAAVVVLAASGALIWRVDLGAPVFGLAIVVPIILLLLLASRVPVVRHALASIPLPVLIAVHAIRILGLLFLLLLAAGRASAPFAPIAGCGDIITGATALPVAFALARRGAGARGLVSLWNSFGLLDLMVASSLGMTSAPGSPIQLFFDPPGSATMATLPWAIIPVFLVPQLIVGHLAVYRRLGHGK
jgi:hypothetical protein